MSNIKVLCDKDELVAIADAVRTKTNSTATMTLAEIPASINNLSSGDDSSLFWDSYQNNGATESYIYRFAGTGWNDTTFKPSYNISMSGDCSYAFASCGVTDLVASLTAQGITLNTAAVTDFKYFCYQMKSTTFPTINFSGIATANVTKQNYIFNQARSLETIEKIILKDGMTFTGWFSYCNKLTNITFEGTISNDIDFSACPKLSKASISNIVSCLSTTVSGKTVKLHATAKAAFSAEELAALKATAGSGWTIT